MVAGDPLRQPSLVSTQRPPNNTRARAVRVWSRDRRGSRTILVLRSKKCVNILQKLSLLKVTSYAFSLIAIIISR